MKLTLLSSILLLLVFAFEAVQIGSSSFRVSKEILTADDKASFPSPFATLTRDAKVSRHQDRQEQP